MKTILILAFLVIAALGVWFILFLINDTIKYYQKKKKRRMKNR